MTELPDIEEQLQELVDNQRRELSSAEAELGEVTKRVEKAREHLQAYESALRAQREVKGTAVEEAEERELFEPESRRVDFSEMSNAEAAAHLFRTPDQQLSAERVADRLLAAGWETSSERPTNTIGTALNREADKPDGLIEKAARGQFRLSPRGVREILGLAEHEVERHE